MPKDIVISLRTNKDNPDHHLWNNRGVWWCYITIHNPNGTTERMRFSLRTRSLEKARNLRDLIFNDIAKHYKIKDNETS